jgi:hypothetical protein
MLVTSAKKFVDVSLAAAVGGTPRGAATRDGGRVTVAGRGTAAGDVKTLGGAATAGPNSALSQSDAARAGTLTGVTGRSE